MVTEAAFGVGVFVFREEPEAAGNLRAVKKLAGEGGHAVHEVGLDEGAADVAFAGLVGGHAATGDDVVGAEVRRRSRRKVLARSGPKSASMPRRAKFITARRRVVVEDLARAMGRENADQLLNQRRARFPPAQ